MSKSKFLKLQNTRLSDYFEVNTNRVLQIDDISGDFSSSDDSRDSFSNILTINPNNNFNRFLVQVTSNDGEHSQLTEIVTLNDDSDIINVVKNSISPNGSEDIISNIEAITDSDDNFYLQFTPVDPFDKDYYIKVIQNNFLTKLSGINTFSVGFVDLLAYNNLVSSGSSVSFVSFDKNTYSSIYAHVNLIDSNLDHKNYVELHVTHDGTNAYISETNFDDVPQYNGRFIGSFTSYIENDVLKIDYINDIDNSVYIRCKNVGFGSTAVGFGTYRFQSVGQPEGSERTCIYESEFYVGNAPSTIDVFSMSKSLFTSCKSLVSIDNGSEVKSLHELSVIHDGNDINVSQFPFISIGSTNGIGTFGGEYSGNNVIVKFYPDSSISGITTILSYNEKIYTALDENIPNVLNYFPNEESITQTRYFGQNLDTINRKEFGMYYKDIPIFSKTFNPSNTATLDKENGLFKIKNHFFSNLERLIYTPRSTFEGVSESPIGIGETLNSVGVLTTKLPEEVYVIKLSTDEFKLSTRKDYAQIGIYVTFTDSGSGNAHELEMYKKNEKTLITINDIVQSPIAYSSLEFSLFNNVGGQIGASSTIFSLSGIGSVMPKDLLKIDEEYIFINNVGLGTTSVGPITFSGDFFLIDGVRGAVGSSATSHSDGTSARIYKGSYNIKGNEIFFTDPPRGSAFFIEEEDFSNLQRAKATFSGRTFLRKNYNSNVVYDDISQNFSGLDTDYTIKVQGINTTGIGTDGGSGILLINGIFQTPTTQNNPNNNFFIIEDEISGISTVSFTGIITSTGEAEISSDDVNKNDLPRGGLIVTLGSSSGLGYAPLVGAAVTVVEDGTGVITGITTNREFGSWGSGYREPVSIALTYSNHTGSAADISVSVGAGGTLAFTINDGGTGYSDPAIIIEPPNYENLPIVGVSRLGIGETTETGIGFQLSVSVEESSVKIVGVGSDVNVLGIPTTTGGRFADAASLIDRNKKFIANEAVNRMIINFGGYPGPGTSTDCEDDVVGVLSCINYNLQYGGNDQVYEAAKIYIDNAYLQGEEVESIYTFEQARDIAIQVMRNDTVSVSPATTQYSQVFDNTIIIDPYGIPYCADVASAITQFVGIVTVAIGQTTLPNKVISSPTLFEVKNFKITKNGYGFRRGDVFKPVGLVTAAELSEPRNEFELTVVDTFNDSFSLWNFGELNYIDSVKNYQDGSRVRFPLFYNSQLLSFEKNENSSESQLIDMDSLLIIFINGVLQNPGESYEFLGGSSFTFTTAPKPEDKISIFFYIGTENEDSIQVNVNETIKIGDSVEVLGISDPIVNPQTSRYILDLSSSDKVETSLYLGEGIDDVNYRPFNWIKQKRDLIINNSLVSKVRDSIEPQVYPTAKIIKNFNSSDTEIFIENIDLFKYDNFSTPVSDMNLAIYDESIPKVSAAATAIIGSNGQLSSLVISNVGQGYIGTVASVRFSRPYEYLSNGIYAIGAGITNTSTFEEIESALDSITISGTLSVLNGKLVEPADFVDLNVGSGYTFTNPPQVVIEPPEPFYDLTTNCSSITGLDVGITSIKLTTGVGVPVGIEFTINADQINALDVQAFQVGYPIYVYGTTVGNGVTSIDSSDSDIVGISTLALDNIYYVHSWDNVTGIITCNVLSTTSISGLPTSTQSNSYPVGRFSWGKISGISRSSSSSSFIVKGNTISGFSTFPTIQRRGYGLRNNGSIKKNNIRPE